MKRPLLDISPARRFNVYGHFTLFYAHPDGTPVLIQESHWRQINGFLVQTKKRRYSVTFRRRTVNF